MIAFFDYTVWTQQQVIVTTLFSLFSGVAFALSMIRSARLRLQSNSSQAASLVIGMIRQAFLAISVVVLYKNDMLLVVPFFLLFTLSILITVWYLLKNLGGNKDNER